MTTETSQRLYGEKYILFLWLWLFYYIFFFAVLVILIIVLNGVHAMKVLSTGEPFLSSVLFFSKVSRHHSELVFD